MNSPIVRPSYRLLLGVAVALVALVASPMSPLPASSAEGAQPRDASARAAACRSGGDFVWSHLRQCGWPAASTTGPRAASCPGDRLRARGTNPSSVIRITRANAVLACQDITGCLSIEAPGVRLHDLAIRCTSGRSGEDANGTAVIDVRPGASARVSRVATNGMRGVHACVWHQGRSLRVNKLDCRGVNDGVFSWGQGGQGDRFAIRNSFFHAFTTRTANGHADGYQTEGAEHGRIVHNTWLMTSDADNQSNSAIAIWNGTRDTRDILVARNLIAGGGFSVYAEDYSPSESSPAGGNVVTGVRFVDNVFSRRLFGCVGNWGVWFSRGRPTDGWHRTGNRVLETRASVDRGNPSYQGRSCS